MLKICIALIVAFVLTMLLSITDTPSELDISDIMTQRYCEMVRLHNEDPSIGWPDYKRIYDKECK